LLRLARVSPRREFRARVSKSAALTAGAGKPARPAAPGGGQAAALGNLKQAAFKANAAIADGRFTRAAIEQFLRQPTKSTLGEKT